MTPKKSKFAVVEWGKLMIYALFGLVMSICVLGASATGGTVVNDSIYTYHTYTANGTFNISIAQITNATILIIGGGGAGGGQSGGGGGAGGLLLVNGSDLTGNISVIIGRGGIGSNPNVDGAKMPENGTLSSFGAYIAYGGGGAGIPYAGKVNGSAGGSGGGAGNNGAAGFGGAGTANQGHAGGRNFVGGHYGTGGGGGAGNNVDTDGNTNYGGNGGGGFSINLNGTVTNYSGGGGGSTYDNGASSIGKGGSGGGGNGSWGADGKPAYFYGGGGGGSDHNANAYLGGSGFQGIVIVRYLTSQTPPNNLISNPSIIKLNSSFTQNDTNLNESHSGIMNIYVNCSIDADGIASVFHNLTLRNTAGNPVYTIESNFTCPGDTPRWFNFDTTLVSDGKYKINVTARSNDTPSDIQSFLSSKNFSIDNNAPVVTVYTPGFCDQYNTTNISDPFYVNVTFIAIDSDLDTCWYSVNGVFDFVNDCDNYTLVPSSTGNYNLSQYANDSLNFLGSDNACFDLCLINFSCSSYDDCDSNNRSNCLTVTDPCGTVFGGNISLYYTNCSYTPPIPADVPYFDLSTTSGTFLFGILIFFWVALAFMALTFRNFAMLSFMWFVGLLLGFLCLPISFILTMCFILFSTLLFMVGRK